MVSLYDTRRRREHSRGALHIYMRRCSGLMHECSVCSRLEVARFSYLVIFCPPLSVDTISVSVSSDATLVVFSTPHPRVSGADRPLPETSHLRLRPSGESLPPEIEICGPSLQISGRERAERTEQKREGQEGRRRDESRQEQRASTWTWTSTGRMASRPLAWRRGRSGMVQSRTGSRRQCLEIRGPTRGSGGKRREEQVRSCGGVAHKRLHAARWLHHMCVSFF